MTDGPSIAKLAQLIAEPARAAMLTELMSGRALTATELANVANVTRQTASSHLAKLHNAELLVLHAQGRHKYFVLANEEVAEVLERLIGLAARAGHVPLVTGPKEAAMRTARSCYDHLAGPLAVAFYENAVQQGWIDQQVSQGCLSRTVQLTEQGSTQLQSLGLPIDRLQQSKRVLCRACMDWSERKNHMAGALGAELLKFCIVKQWAAQDKGSRVVSFNPAGETAFRNAFVKPCVP